MHPNALLDLSCELLRAVLQLDSPADSVVSAFFRKHKALGQRERHALAETAYAVLRQRPLLQHFAQSGSGPTERRLAILAWQGNSTFLRGALSEQEKQWLEQVQAMDKSGLPAKLRHCLPEWLAKPLLERLGEEQFWLLAESMNEQAPLDLRVNTLKIKREEAQEILKAANIDAQLTPFSPIGLPCTASRL
jgi:16S rRNA (cytosine967-C5)-methyltransferase